MDPIEQIHSLLRSESFEEARVLPPPSSLPELRLRLQSLALPYLEEEPIARLFQDAITAWHIKEAPPYVLPDDPLETLGNLLKGHVPEVEEDTPVVAALERNDEGATYAIHTLLGAELLRLAQTQALPPAARKEALEATMIALINPTTENVRAILRALVKGLDV